MKTYLRRLSQLGILISLALPVRAATVRIYAANKGGTTFDVIDPSTNKIVKVIEDLEAPETARFSPDGSRIYLTYGGENILRVMDQKSGKYIKDIPLSGWANDIAVTRDGKLILVCIHESPGGLDIIDAASLEKVNTIPLKNGLHDVDVTEDGKYAAAGSPDGHFLVVFDLQSKQVAWQLPFEDAVQTLAIEKGPNGSAGRIFVNVKGFHGFAIVDFATHKETSRVQSPEQPSGFREPGGPASHGMAIAPDGKTLWVNSVPANSVFVYSLPDLKLLGHISMPELNVSGKPPRTAHPGWITFTPDSKTVYITNEALNQLVAIDVKGMKQTARIPIGERPGRISTLVLP
jgi:YVTN family beta-propeller protein